jgi:hypothetical protein
MALGVISATLGLGDGVGGSAGAEGPFAVGVSISGGGPACERAPGTTGPGGAGVLSCDA